MGQRLVMNFQLDGETIVSTYQHWNGFTIGALNTVIETINTLRLTDKRYTRAEVAKLAYLSFGRDMTSSIEAILANHLNIPYNGAGLIEGDYENPEIAAEIGLPLGENRNAGYIAVTKESIESLNNWGEQFVIIDLRTLKANIRNLLYDITEEDKKFVDYGKYGVLNFPEFVKDLEKDYYSRDELQILSNFFKGTSYDSSPGILYKNNGIEYVLVG